MSILQLEEARMASLDDLRADIIRSAARGQGPTFIAAKLDMLIVKVRADQHDELDGNAVTPEQAVQNMAALLASLTIQKLQLIAALRDLCDAIPDATISADPPLGCWVNSARLAIAKAEAE